MKRVNNHMIILVVIMLIMSVKLEAQVYAGVSTGRGGGGGTGGFYMTIGRYFSVPQREVVIVRDRRLPDEEIPVVFFVARKAGVSPRGVARLRRQGYSWMDITYQLGLGPEIFFSQGALQGPPYGRARGYYKHHRVIVSDYDAINAVNSRLISESYNCRQDDVIKMRNQGRSYVQINDMYYGNGRNGEDQYNYHNRDRYDNGNQNDENRNDNYGYGDPRDRN
ncbi:MAG: hypothetical protein HF314_13895 [Ignavibacteria bacterium]|nr:hypothetical protein [Ignavibacteria bacterium]MCU7504171.1 hypothetical protein [Ignavibacteria bacterium]MCU7516379.1 hypothetical protein [Ignavibacteria bacterium]